MMVPSLSEAGVVNLAEKRRLVAQDEIVVPAMSERKGLIILLSWIAAALAALPFIISLVDRGKFGDMGAVLLLLLLESILFGVGFFPCMWITRGWRRDGELRCTLDRLSLSIDGKQWSLDFRQLLICRWDGDCVPPNRSDVPGVRQKLQQSRLTPLGARAIVWCRRPMPVTHGTGNGRLVPRPRLAKSGITGILYVSCRESCAS